MDSPVSLKPSVRTIGALHWSRTVSVPGVFTTRIPRSQALKTAWRWCIMQPDIISVDSREPCMVREVVDGLRSL